MVPEQSGADDRRTGEGVLRFALFYPGRRGWKTVLVGAVVLLFFWLIVPALIAAGYFVRLTRKAGRGDPEPPAFDDWTGMLVDGVVLVAVFLPVVIVYTIVVFVAAEVHDAIGFLVAIAGFYAFPGIYMNYSVTGDWKAAYDLSTLGDQITTTTYLYGFVLFVFVVNGIGAIVATLLLILSVLTIVGWIILWPMIYFYWYGIDAALWGRVYNRLESS